MRRMMDLDKPFEKSPYAQFRVGDTVDVGVKITEVVEKSGKGGIEVKERVQVYTGTVIRAQGSGVRKTFTVRRIVQGEGVERIVPIHSPRIAKVEVKRTGRVRRAKLYYLRDRVGKATRLRERETKEEVAAKLNKKKAAAAAAAAKAEAAKPQ